MANKFGKFILVTAAIGTACAAAYYYMQKKDDALAVSYGGDDDYDDFEDLTAESETARNYVPLSHDTVPAKESEPAVAADCVESSGEKAPAEETEDTFTSLKDSVRDITEESVPAAQETVEEFFDEDDPNADEEPPISDET